MLHIKHLAILCLFQSFLLEDFFKKIEKNNLDLEQMKINELLEDNQISRAVDLIKGIKLYSKKINVKKPQNPYLKAAKTSTSTKKSKSCSIFK